MGEGTTVGRDVRAGGDFVGQDKLNSDGSSVGNRVEIHAVGGMAADDPTVREMVQRVYQELAAVRVALLGDPYNRGNPGLVFSVDRLKDSVSSIISKQATADYELAAMQNRQIEYQVVNDQRVEGISRRQNAFMVIMWATLALVGVEGVSLAIFFISFAGG
tara:strand:- start:557 stop:1039 length:483 start_codon:yes stop_codon:yes gene_type:complete